MKDHATFLAAAHLFAERNADARFVLVGGGPADYRTRLEDQVSALGLCQRVIFAGEHADVAAAYNAFDVATLSSSYGEGFPNALGEAMACGVPVAATDIGDIATVVADCGVIVPPRRPDHLCAAWTRLRQGLARDPERLRAAQRDRIVMHFSMEAMTRKSERVLAALCAGQSARDIVAALDESPGAPYRDGTQQ